MPPVSSCAARTSWRLWVAPGVVSNGDRPGALRLPVRISRAFVPPCIHAVERGLPLSDQTSARMQIGTLDAHLSGSTARRVPDSCRPVVAKRFENEPLQKPQLRQRASSCSAQAAPGARRRHAPARRRLRKSQCWYALFPHQHRIQIRPSIGQIGIERAARTQCGAINLRNQQCIAGSGRGDDCAVGSDQT
jgi:hypothetical protein